MIEKPFDLINKENIDALIVNAVAESKTIEYKETLPMSGDSDKKEFLADITSFANAAGGDILYGIKPQRDDQGKTTGLPEAVLGLANLNADQEILRLESMIRDGIDPRINGIQIKPITGFTQGAVLLIRVPKSWASPHMVVFKNESRFYSRTSAGKYQLDVGEIRTAFALSESLGEKVKRFREERLGRIMSDETPVPLVKGDPKAVIHIVPISSFTVGMELDIAVIAKRPEHLRLLHSGGWHLRNNFDGVLSFDNEPPNSSYSYMQVFRNGIIESVDTYITTVPSGSEKLIPSAVFESGLIDGLQHYLGLLKEWEVGTPVFVSLSLIGVEGYSMASNDYVARRLYGQRYCIDRDVLRLPEIVVEDLNVDTSPLLKSPLDAIWQAAGWVGSPNYDKDGKWIRQYG